MQESSHQHEVHGHGTTSSKRRLGVVTALNVIGFVLEVAGGVLFGSVALLSDAVHMLFDATAYATAFGAAYIAEAVEGSEEWTYGYHRVEVVSALLNGLLLIPMAGWIVWESYRRFLSPVTVDIVPALAVASLGLAVNLVSVLYLRDGGRLSLNEKGAFYHLLGDTGGSFAVIVGLVAISLTGIEVIDPVIAVLIAVVVVVSAGKVLIEGAEIILQKSPIDPEEIAAVVEGIDGVEGAHDIKSWSVCSNVNVCTVHAEMSVRTLEEAEEVRKRVDKELKDRFNLQHVTLQIEQEATQDNAVEH